MVEPTTPPADGGNADKGKPDGTGSPPAPYKLPKKFEGKSPQEIVESYLELEKEYHDRDTTIEEAKKIKEETDTMLRAIYADPNLFKAVENGIKNFISGKKLPESRPNANDNPDDKGGEGADKNKSTPDVAELRTNEENRALDSLFSKYGYKTLPVKERKEAYQRLSMALVELLDPSGKKTVKEVMAGIPITRLPRYLEHAHFLANRDNFIKDARNSGALEERNNESATFGSFATAGGKPSEGVTLTNPERETARKLGISEEKYAKQKGKMIEEKKKYS